MGWFINLFLLISQFGVVSDGISSSAKVGVDVGFVGVSLPVSIGFIGRGGDGDSGDGSGMGDGYDGSFCGGGEVGCLGMMIKYSSENILMH